MFQAGDGKDTEAMPYKTKKRKSLFPYVVIIFVLLLALLALGGLYFLWDSLERYELSTPRYAMQQVEEILKQKDLPALAQLCGVDESRFFDEDQYAAYLEQEMGDDWTDLRIAESHTDEPGAVAYQAISDTGRLTFLLYARKEGGYTIRQPEIPVSSYRIYAPEHAVVLVNGTALTTAQAAADYEPPELFRELDAALAPQMLEYRVDGFVTKPTVELRDCTATEYHVEESGDTFTITTYPTEAERAEYAALAEEFSRTYALYVSKDLSFDDVKPYLYPESSIYDTIRTIDRSWYIDHQPPTISDLQVTNIVTYSDDHFTAEVSFTFTVISDINIQHETYPHYRLAFFRTEEGLRLVNLQFL